MSAQPWFTQPLRIAALQCNFENGKTLEVIDKWLAAGFNTEQLFHPMADSYAANFDPALHSDILRQYLSKARAGGLRIILYQNVHIISPAQRQHRQEWATRDREGKLYSLYGTYEGCCVNSPWRDWFFAALRALHSFAIDGLFLDGPVVPVCYCPSCQSRYHRETGGDLFTATDLAPFFTRSRGDFVRETYRLFKELKPDAACYWNFPALDPDPSYADLAAELPCNDILGTEGGFMFYGPAKDSFLWQPSVCAKVIEALAPEKPRVIFMAANHTPWSWHLHTAAETRLCIASASAHGASLWYGLCGSTDALLNRPGSRAAAEMMHQLARHAASFHDTASAADVAVLYSYDTQRSYRAGSRASDLYGKSQSELPFQGDASASFHGACDILARSSIAFDVFTDFALTAEKLARYRCLILPTSACLSDETCAVLRAFVAAGGNLIASFDSSLYDPAGKSRQNLALGDVLGVRFAGQSTRYENFNHFAACAHVMGAALDLFPDNAMDWLPAPEYGLDVQPLPAAQVLARFHQPQAGRYTNPTPLDQPAVVYHRFAAGQTLYLAGTFFEMSIRYAHEEHRRLLAHAVQAFSQPPARLRGGLGNVEVVLRRQGWRLLVHLVNYAGVPPRPFYRLAPQPGLTLELPAAGYTTARALFADQPCPMQKNDAGTVVTLPTLEAYEVIVLE